MNEFDCLALTIAEASGLTESMSREIANEIDSYINFKLEEYFKNKENDYVKYCKEIAKGM